MQSTNQKKIAVWQPYFMGGGAEAVALWTLEALVEQYEVVLHTLVETDIVRLNSMYGTNLSAQKLNVKTVFPASLTRIISFAIANFSIFRIAFIHLSLRHFKSVSSEYDGVASVYNAADLGRRGIQYLHWVNVNEKQPEKASLFLKLLMRWSKFSHDQLKDNISIANSTYTADRVFATYGIKASVIHPPVVSEIEQRSWQQKENAFLCSGRVVEPKQTHRVIKILQAVRQQGFDISLYITGGGGGTYRWGYQRKIQQLAEKNSDWIQFYQDLPYQDYLEIVARCRYGIHYKPEPFGISVAEMVKAGMIPFVRSKGGQIEIVGSDNQSILFAREADAVKKIIAVLSNPEEQGRLLQCLSAQKSLFSTERFASEIKSSFNHYLAEDLQNV